MSNGDFLGGPIFRPEKDGSPTFSNSNKSIFERFS